MYYVTINDNSGPCYSSKHSASLFTSCVKISCESYTLKQVFMYSTSKYSFQFLLFTSDLSQNYVKPICGPASSLITNMQVKPAVSISLAYLKHAQAAK
jgi:hypothetical protein